VTTFGPFTDGAGNYTSPIALTTGPDGALWFASFGHWLNGGPMANETPGYIGRLTTTGAVSLYPLSSGEPWTITSGSDGSLWFGTTGNWVNTTYMNGYIGRMSTSGIVTKYGAISGAPPSMTAGSDGALWFTDGSAVGRITTDGTMTTYPLSGADPLSITAGPDGALWFTDYSYSPSPDFSTHSGSIGRITTSGQISLYESPGIYIPYAITSGPDGAVWFVDYLNDTIGRIATP
jgi:virginiamycin B lyase